MTSPCCTRERKSMSTATAARPPPRRPQGSRHPKRDARSPPSRRGLEAAKIVEGAQQQPSGIEVARRRCAVVAKALMKIRPNANPVTVCRTDATPAMSSEGEPRRQFHFSTCSASACRNDEYRIDGYREPNPKSPLDDYPSRTPTHHIAESSMKAEYTRLDRCRVPYRATLRVGGKRRGLAR
jgi:hypothetical protein